MSTFASESEAAHNTKTETYLPARDNRKVHRCFHVNVARRLELLTLVADDVAEAFNSGSSDCHLGANELIMQVNSFR